MKKFLKQSLIALAVMLAMVAVVSLAVYAATPDYEASVGNTQYATLQDAINAAQDGDTVLIKKDLSISKTVNVIGKNIKIDGSSSAAGTNNGVTISKGGSIYPAIRVIGGGDVIFEDIVFDGWTSANVIHIGSTTDSSKNYAYPGYTNTYSNYNIYFNNVDFNFTASCAIYVYDCTDITVFINDCDFVAGASGKAVINHAGSGYVKGTAMVCYHDLGKTNIANTISNITTYAVDGIYADDTTASKEGMVARFNDTTTSPLVKPYFDTVQKAVSAAKSGDKIYVISNIDNIGTVSLSGGKAITIEGTSKFEVGTTQGKAFSLSSGANLTIKNLKFVDIISKNLVIFGEDSTTTYDYAITLEDVECNFSASGAIYGYKVSSATVTLNDCVFNASTKNQAVVYFARALSVTVNVNCENLSLNSNAIPVGYIADNNGKVNVSETLANDDVAVARGVLAYRDTSGKIVPYKVGTGHKLGVNYFLTAAEYFSAATNANSIEINKNVVTNYNFVYNPNTWIDKDTSTGTQAGHDYNAADSIREALGYSAAKLKPYSSSLTGKSVYVGIVDKELVSTYLNNIYVDEYAVIVEADGDVFLLAHHDKALAKAVDMFKSFIKDGKAILPVGVHKFIADTKWIDVTEFPQPENVTLNATQYVNNDSLQYLYEGADLNKYNAYIAKLNAAGYTTVIFNEVIGKNNFTMLENKTTGIVLYVAYNDFTYGNLVSNYNYNGIKYDTAASGENIHTAYDDYRLDFDKCIRVVAMPAESIVIPDSAITTPNPTYTKVTNSAITTVGVASPGTCYIITLEDGRFIVVDGGQGYSGDLIWQALVQAYNNIHTDDPWQAGDKITIAAWYLTHSHSDHWAEFYYFASKGNANYGHGNDIELQYVIANGIDIYSIAFAEGAQTNFMDAGAGTNSMQTVLNWTGAKFIKAHTGQKFYFANVELEILMTFEDHLPVSITNSNDTNTIIRFNISTTNYSNGAQNAGTADANRVLYTKSFLSLGDSHINAGRYLVAMYGEYLKSDMVSLAHHGNKSVEPLLYEYIKAEVVFVPNLESVYARYFAENDKAYSVLANKNAQKYAAYIWFAGSSTSANGLVGTLLSNTLYFTADGLDYENFGATNYHIHNYTIRSYDDEYHCMGCICGDIKESTKAKHSGGTATCMSGKICEECEAEYGNVDPANHTRANTTIENYKAPSCIPGYTGDTYCECGEKIADGEVISATGNHYDNPTDGDHKCEGCTYVFENACADAANDGDHKCDDCGAADITQHTGGTATCMAKKACSDCGAAYGDVDPANHTRANTTLKNYAAATCATAGYTGDTYCECDVKLADGTAIPATGEHADNPNDGDHKCEGCNHVFENACADAANDGDHNCDDCGAADITQHTGGTATCMAKKACSDCGAEYGEKAPTNHTGNTTIKNAAAATCATAGYTGDTYCECGVKLATGTAIAATGEHVDAANDGDHKCDACAYVLENACADTNNDYKCDECGAACGEAPTTTAPTTTEATTIAPTITAPTTTSAATKKPSTTTAAKEEKGCGGTVTVAGLALVASLGTCAVFVEKKRR